MPRFSLLRETNNARTRLRRRRDARRILKIDALESRLMFDATPIPGLSDEFSDPATLSQWERIHEVEGWNADQLDVYDIDATQPGRMVQQPHTTVWYENWRGPLAFKSVTGDFVFTTEIHITDRDNIGGSDDDDVPADGQFSLAGVMIRTPRPITDPAIDWSPGSMSDDGTNNGENYVFLSLGYGNGADEFALEVKTTRNSNSQLELTSLGAAANTATVQTARIGDSIITLYRLPGQDWQVHRRFSRPDMPETIQVGLVSYTDWGKASDFDPFTQNSSVLIPGVQNDPTPGEPFNPDLTAGFEYARYALPDVPDAIIGADLTDPSQVSDSDLLSFLGDNANIEPGQNEILPPSPLVAIELAILDSIGNPVTELEVGQSFTLQAIVDDLRPDGSGVFSAFVDITYDNSLANPTAEPIFGEVYINAQEGSTAIPGLIDEAGAIASTDMLGNEPRILFSIPLVATAAGELIFEGNPADLLPDHEVTIYGGSLPVPADRIQFVAATLNILPPIPSATATDDEFTVFNDAQPITLDVLANDAADPATTDTLAIVEVSPVANGIVEINTEGNRILFTPTAGFFGDTSFEYMLRDTNGQEASATVSLSVHKRWQNQNLAMDVNGDQFTSPMDALIVINSLFVIGATPLPNVPPLAIAGLPYIDTNGDGTLSPADALVVINELIRRALERRGMGGEGESAAVVERPTTAPAQNIARPHSPVRNTPWEVSCEAPPATQAASPCLDARRVDRCFSGDGVEDLLEDVCLATLAKTHLLNAIDD